MDLATLGLLLSSLTPVSGSAQPIPDIELEHIATGFKFPTHITHAGDGSDRLFVVEQRGYIRVVDRSSAQRHRVFLALKKDVESGGEKGLLSVAFHPDFENNQRLFINYTTLNDGKLTTQISEVQASKDRRFARPLSARSILRFDQPYANHNGGLLKFGPDGFLYIGNGDGGASNDPGNYGQKLDTVLGKILRINVNAQD